MNIKEAMSAAFFFSSYIYNRVLFYRSFYELNLDYVYCLIELGEGKFFYSKHKGYIIPADEDEYDKWLSAYKTYGIEKELYSKNIFNIMLIYLKMYKKNFNTDVTGIIDLLQDMLSSTDGYIELEDGKIDLWPKWEYYLEKKYRVIYS